MREENFWYLKPRYSEVRVITRRVIARHGCIERLVMDNRDIPVEGKIKFLKTTKTQHGKTLQKFSLPDENETLRVISYFPDTP